MVRGNESVEGGWLYFRAPEDIELSVSRWCFCCSRAGVHHDRARRALVATRRTCT